MPYLRLHLPEVPLEQKRVIAQKVIEITMRAFGLRPQERYQVSVEFISERQSSMADSFHHESQREANCLFEVIGHDLTEKKKRAFAEETSAFLTPLLPANWKMRLARLLGVKPNESRQIAFQFGELSPAVSEPFVVYSGSQAA
jgi:phenylpyruvate tautomerase PptA (4-oxalocrotonate tautomerase family)